MRKKEIFISGFSTVRNGVALGYPLVESIRSVLPVVDEFVISVGKSDDATLATVRRIRDPKIKIIGTVWDPRFTARGRILAVQTNIALFQCTGHWAFYIQADEVFHEADHARIVDCCERYRDHDAVDGFLFDYTHFFGNYDWYGDSYHWYRKEIRVIRNHRGISSWRDAQSFRVDGKKIAVMDSGCRMFHYGWVRPPAVMARKRQQMDRLYHGAGYTKQSHRADFDYMREMDTSCMKHFTGTHPELMGPRIKRYAVDFDPRLFKSRPTIRDLKRRMVNAIGKATGWYPGEYRNYRLLRPGISISANSTE